MSQPQTAVLSTAGQILPFAATNETNNSTETNGKKRVKRSLLDDEDSDNNNETAAMTCCERLQGLCSWIEEVPEVKENQTSMIDELDLKLSNWTDAECELIYPCDMAHMKVRFQQHLDAMDAADKALVSERF